MCVTQSYADSLDSFLLLFGKNRSCLKNHLCSDVLKFHYSVIEDHSLTMTRGKKSRSPTSPSSDLVTQSTTLPQSGKISSETVHADDKSETTEMPISSEIEFEKMQTEKDECETVSSQRSNKIQ